MLAPLQNTGDTHNVQVSKPVSSAMICLDSFIIAKFLLSPKGEAVYIRQQGTDGFSQVAARIMSSRLTAKSHTLRRNAGK